MKKILTLLVLSLFCVLCAVCFAACDNTKTITNNTTNTNSTSDNTPSNENNLPATTYYTVTFNSDGGTPIAPAQIEEGKKCNAPDDPYKIGYAFDGWFVGNEQWSFIGYTVTENVTLTAHWSIDENNLGIFDWEKTDNEYTITGVKDKTLTEITIPDYITNIRYNAFTNCNKLQTVTIGNNIKKIGAYAFSDCSALKNITIPDSVMQIDTAAFSRCTSLTTITVSKNNDYYKSIDGNLYTKDGKTLIQYAIGKTTTDFNIPYNVTHIGEYAFCGCLLTSITIPDSVTNIEYAAFDSCTLLNNLTIGNGVKNIGQFAFNYCLSLTSVSIPNSVTTIEDWAFCYCKSLSSIIIPNSVTSIGQFAFYRCTKLTNVTFENTNGWQVSTYSNMSDVVIFSSGILANTQTAATYLKSTFNDYYWQRV